MNEKDRAPGQNFWDLEDQEDHGTLNRFHAERGKTVSKKLFPAVSHRATAQKTTLNGEVKISLNRCFDHQHYLTTGQGRAKQEMGISSCP